MSLVLVAIGFATGVVFTAAVCRYTTRSLVPSPLRSVLRSKAPALVRPMIAPPDALAA